MHGRPRKASKPEDLAASAAKAAKLRSLQSQFLSFHHNNIYTEEALKVSAKLLETNPEAYTAWNYRKLAVQHNLASSDSTPEAVKSIVDQELALVETALRQNPKSYGAWHHRKWVLSKGHSSINHELRLLDLFQKMDSRNFHAWNYRRFVTELMNRSEEDELKYTTNMIETNFSNYSAWHNRSILLTKLMKKKVQGFFPKENILTEEYDLVHNALFTDPDDQSGWFYHLWLIDQTVKADAPLLVSSWPAPGSDIILSENNCLGGFSSATFHSDSSKIPLILYFNQAVEGVSSSTVTVDSVLNSNKDLIWKPLSVNNSLTAQVWVTHLSFGATELHSPKTFKVEVRLGHSEGIVSSNGFHYSHPTQFTFTVCVQPIEKKPSEKLIGEMLSWEDEKFHICGTQLEESIPIVFFNELSINKDNKDEPTASQWHVKTIANEIALIQELFPETEYKILKLTLARLLTAHDAILSPSSDKIVHSEEVLKLYNDLIKFDPPHSQYYKDERSRVLLQQVTSSRESLLKHCFCYQNSSSSSISNPLLLRLNNLSLSRLGSIDKLLWVQMLDLSHNELRSIEGLEAMQLLTCLNLSNNKLGSFTALGPLRLIKSLKVLDISHNEIGSHSIDTTRYSCSSPLSHTEEIDWGSDEAVAGGVNMKKHWEAYMIFKGMELTQLHIAGNVIAGENFKLLLVKTLPTLKWLDDEELH